MKRPEPSTKLRIVHQASTPQGRRYYLACERGRLDLQFAPLVVEGATSWRIDAKLRVPLSTDALVTETGGSLTEALRSVARTYEGNDNASIFDWKAVEGLLVEFQAL
jgi:hypothetical protein